MKRFIALLAFACAAFGGLRADDAVFIAHPDVKAESLSATEVKAILLGNQTSWSGGGNLKLAVLTSGPVHEAVLRAHTERSADQFEKYWKKIVFTGKGAMPEQADDEASLIAYVAKTPGALGYVTAGSAPSGVKVLPVR